MPPSALSSCRDQFTLRQLQEIHETILGRTLNKDSFRRRLLASGLIAPTGKLEQDVGHRPAELYRFQSAERPQCQPQIARMTHTHSHFPKGANHGSHLLVRCLLPPPSRPPRGDRPVGV